MKARLFICLPLLLFCSPISAQKNYPRGIVYGPKAAFNIAAPEGWVLDNTSGTEQGLPCVLYRKGASWADAKAIMYAKIAGTQFEDVNAFVAMAIKEMQKTHDKPKGKSPLVRRGTVTTTLLMSIQRPSPTHNGNASLTSNYRTP